MSPLLPGWGRGGDQFRAQGLLRHTMFCDKSDPTATHTSVAARSVRVLPHVAPLCTGLFAAALTKTAHAPSDKEEWVHRTEVLSPTYRAPAPPLA